MTSPSSSSKHEAKSEPKLGFAESIRQRFEKLHRQTELALDVNCFRPGGKLSSIRFIAHPHGLHVRRWLEVLSHTQATVTIDTPVPVPTFSSSFASARSIIPRFLKLPMWMRYLLSGVVLRFFDSGTPQGVLHAHSASGNGLVAWLSGQPYLIGTYGSEIYEAEKRGPVYRWLLKQILQGAQRIHNALPSNNAILCQQFDIPAEKIYSFHLGYDEKCFRWIDQPQRDQMRHDRGLPKHEPIWVVCRRTHPHYRTIDVVSGFLDYCHQGGQGRLVVLCGDHQRSYTEMIRETVKVHQFGNRIVIVEPMLSPIEFASWLQICDFSISVPRTDNFSNAILESMGCGAVPVLADLTSYDDVRPCRSIRWMTQFEAPDFTKMYWETSKSFPHSMDAERSECFEFVQSWYSTEHAIRVLSAFYLGEPLPARIAQDSVLISKAA